MTARRNIRCFVAPASVPVSFVGQFSVPAFSCLPFQPKIGSIHDGLEAGADVDAAGVVAGVVVTGVVVAGVGTDSAG